MSKYIEMTFAEVRQIIKERNISEGKFREWLIKNDYVKSYQDLLELIVHHLYHSTEEHLYAPSHLLQAFLKDYRTE